MDVNKRINRIIGQLRGIERMTGQKRECSEILQQLLAVKKAINGLSREIVMSSVCRILPDKEVEKLEKMMGQMIEL